MEKLVACILIFLVQLWIPYKSISVTSILVIQIELANHVVLNLKANVEMDSMEKYFINQTFLLQIRGWYSQKRPMKNLWLSLFVPTTSNL